MSWSDFVSWMISIPTLVKVSSFSQIRAASRGFVMAMEKASAATSRPIVVGRAAFFVTGSAKRPVKYSTRSTVL